MVVGAAVGEPERALVCVCVCVCAEQAHGGAGHDGHCWNYQLKCHVVTMLLIACDGGMCGARGWGQPFV